jgi:hypothetical protein
MKIHLRLNRVEVTEPSTSPTLQGWVLASIHEMWHQRTCHTDGAESIPLSSERLMLDSLP